jgi:hypothetical protein
LFSTFPRNVKPSSSRLKRSTKKNIQQVQTSVKVNMWIMLWKISKTNIGVVAANLEISDSFQLHCHLNGKNFIHVILIRRE